MVFSFFGAIWWGTLEGNGILSPLSLHSCKNRCLSIWKMAARKIIDLLDVLYEWSFAKCDYFQEFSIFQISFIFLDLPFVKLQFRTSNRTPINAQCRLHISFSKNKTEIHCEKLIHIMTNRNDSHDYTFLFNFYGQINHTCLVCVQ